MTIENSRIIGRFVATYEVLKDKGIFTDADIEAKLKQFEEIRQKKQKEFTESEQAKLAEQQREWAAKKQLESTRRELVAKKEEINKDGDSKTP